MTRMRTVRTPRWLLAVLGPLMLVLIVSTDAFAACPSVFNFNFSGSQYTECFRELLRGSDIIDGTDQGSTGHTALNFTGSTVAGGSTWLTVYDATPAVADENPTFGAETLCADVLIQPYNNAKGAGVVALMNEGAGKKGLGLFISDAGSTDTLILSTVDGDPAQKGKLTTVTSVSLQGGIAEKAWYRVVMTVTPAGTPKVTGKVFAHATATDPNSALGGQVGSTLTYSGALPAGVTSPGENGIMASAISSVVNSSVTNFTNDPVACGVSTARYVDNGDGTVTDTQTGLMWEKKVAGSGCLHCVGDTYTWSNGMSEFVSDVNGTTDDPNTQTGLAGHSDWRLPTIVELQTILLAPFPCGTSPCIDPIFGPTAASFFYWSSSTSASAPAGAWVVGFVGGLVVGDGKSSPNFARAVRGGS
jgi:hypothetical protein